MYKVYLGKVALPVPPSKIEISSPSRNETVDLINGSQVSIIKQGGLPQFNLEFELPSQQYPYVLDLDSISKALDEGISAAKNYVFDAAKGAIGAGIAGYMLGGGSGAASAFGGAFANNLAANKDKLFETGIALASSVLSDKIDSLTGKITGNSKAWEINTKIINYFDSLKGSKMPFQFIVNRSINNGKVKIPLGTNVKVTLEDYTLTEDATNGSDIVVTVNLLTYKEYSTKTYNEDGSTSATRSK